MDIHVKGFFPEATCHRSGKSGEAVLLNSKDDNIEKAVLSFREMENLIRFRYFQEEQQKKTADNSPKMTTPNASPVRTSSSSS